MKKVIIILFLIVVVSTVITEEKNILIPDNAIRFRVIANSDNIEDQKLKLSIKNVDYRIAKKEKNKITETGSGFKILKDNLEKWIEERNI